MATADGVIEQLKMVLDPELGVNVVDLGLIYDIEIEGGHVAVTMTLTTPGCPLHESLSASIKKVVSMIPEVEDVKVNLVWSPPWNPTRMTQAAREQLARR